ncbi:phosphotransferase family protein [Auritidibacter sp. NML100628]|uniref:phosphotransferase family protein n=1 Tax=Auritidibacter sp. NML100628 TaxID=2170742 RepID=UPI000D72FF6B|nr:phosphotransferase family protein [Auritidibacter sp. NML100628]PXA76999.1 acyl-CoA dehydrogenase [Auritidibacter sp. NML100628]
MSEPDNSTDHAAPGEDLPGLSLAAVRTYLDDHHPGLVDPEGQLSADLITGGKSNITYRITDGRSTWALRRPPIGHVLATAHDMSREYRVISALTPTSFPVPNAVTLCEDTEVLGAPFYLMDFIEGTTYRYARQLEPIGAERTRKISERILDTLVDLHAIDPAEVGLQDFGKPANYLQRQVSRWKKQLDASLSRDIPEFEQLHRRLESQIPEHSEVSIVHGDFRLDNTLIGATGTDQQDEVLAVLDWEMATLGDPLADLALTVVYNALATRGGRAAESVSDVALAPGFISQDELLQRYAERSQRDLDQIDFYLGLGAFKLAVIMEGIHYRYLQGKTVGEGFDKVGELGPAVLAYGLEHL